MIVTYDVFNESVGTIGRYKSLEEVKYKDSLQSGKTYILGNDIDFKSSIPNVYKNDKCEWSTKFKETEISASFNPYYNQKKDEYTWVADNFLAFPLDDEGKVTPCPKGSHEMVPHYFISTRRQISSIIFKNSKYEKYYISVASVAIPWLVPSSPLLASCIPE